MFVGAATALNAGSRLGSEPGIGSESEIVINCLTGDFYRVCELEAGDAV